VADFFVSYTSVDRAWAEWLAWQLEQTGYRVIVHAWYFEPGNNFVVRMRDALEHADRTLARGSRPPTWPPRSGRTLAAAVTVW
jgi:hypothetical protein